MVHIGLEHILSGRALAMSMIDELDEEIDRIARNGEMVNILLSNAAIGVLKHDRPHCITYCNEKMKYCGIDVIQDDAIGFAVIRKI
jgi:hypothetical protein